MLPRSVVVLFNMANQTQQAGGAKPKPPVPAAGAAEKKPPVVKSKSERFKEIAPARTRDILKKLEILGNCSNTSGYEFTQENVEKIFGTIEKKVAEIKAKFKPKAPGETKAAVSFEL